MRHSAIYVGVLLFATGGVGCSRIQPTNPTLKTTETQDPEDWLDATKQAYRSGDVEVRVTGARFGQPRVRDVRSGEQPPAGNLLIVYFEIKNNSRTKKNSHLSWAKADGHFVARLQDEKSNGYARHAFIYCGEVDGVKTTDREIQPGGTDRDLVAFDVPIAKVTTLRLSLPGMQIGQQGSVQFKIPVGMVERK
ncbi:MAG TPA: hypothetical protein VHR66_18920 [Gemmataceae bacterium]|jgi:hypothetical protein|nr:hypothetical protein [Gemmataceae bacterium]